MAKISYLNGDFVPHEKACVPIDDRGLQFSDAVYEVVAFFNGKALDFEQHMNRLARSLDALSINYSVDPEVWRRVLDELIHRNQITCGIVYLQITRGVAPRDHGFPAGDIKPTVIATARALDMTAIKKRMTKGVKVILMPENRWARTDIKSTSLLPNVLAKEAARQAGAYEAWFVDAGGAITEGTASNAWIISGEGKLITRRADGAILAGITRAVLLEAAGGDIAALEERGFTPAELAGAKEAFLTSTTSFVMPVVKIGENAVADGKPGVVTRALQEIYEDHIRKQTGFQEI